jgi:hypothetical protein
MGFINRLSFIVLLLALVPFASASIFINEFLANEPGTNTSLEWIELYNNESASIDLSGWNLTDGQDYFSIASVIQGNSYLIFYGYETGISLNNGGDTINLTNNESALINSVTYSSSTENVSRGRYPDGSSNFANFLQTTPNFTNTYAPMVVLNEPLNNSLTNRYPVILNYTASDDFNSTIFCTLYINGTQEDSSVVANNTHTTISKNLPDGNYIWHVSCSDGYLLSESNRSYFAIDTVPRSSIIETTTQNSINLNLTFSEITLFNFTSSFGNYSNSSNTTYLFSFPGLSHSTLYNYTLDYCDNSGNCNSTFRIFSTQGLPPSESCFDNIQNQDEDGIDCGGVCAAKCPTRYHSSGGGGAALSLITAKHTLNFTNTKENYSIRFSGLDRIMLIFQNKTYILMFSNTSFDGTNIRFYPTRYNVSVPLGKNTTAGLSNESIDVQFFISEITENADAYRKFGIKDYMINLSAQVVSLKKPKPIVNETPVVVKNITIEEKAPEPKFGKIEIRAKSSYYTPTSGITGFIITGTIIVVGIGLYFGLRKIFVW